MCFSYNLASSIGRATLKVQTGSAQQPTSVQPLVEAACQATPRFPSPIDLSADTDSVVDTVTNSKTMYIRGDSEDTTSEDEFQGHPLDNSDHINTSAIAPPDPSILVKPKYRGKRFYVVSKGLVVGIHSIWRKARASAHVNGAQMVSFRNWGEAKRYWRMCIQRGYTKILSPGDPQSCQLLPTKDKDPWYVSRPTGSKDQPFTFRSSSSDSIPSISANVDHIPTTSQPLSQNVAKVADHTIKPTIKSAVTPTTQQSSLLPKSSAGSSQIPPLLVAAARHGGKKPKPTIYHDLNSFTAAVSELSASLDSVIRGTKRSSSSDEDLDPGFVSDDEANPCESFFRRHLAKRKKVLTKTASTPYHR